MFLAKRDEHRARFSSERVSSSMDTAPVVSSSVACMTLFPMSQRYLRDPARLLKDGYIPTSSYGRVTTPRQTEPQPPRRVIPETTDSPARTQHDFLFTDERIKNSPSFRDGIPNDVEWRCRYIGIFCIQDICERLNDDIKRKGRIKVSSLAVATAMYYLHRFYMYHSVGTFNPLYVAAGSLFLAAKTNECPRRLADFSVIMHSLENPKEPPLVHEDDLAIPNKVICGIESLLLQTLAFNTGFSVPHPEIVSFTGLDRTLQLRAFHLSTTVVGYSQWSIKYKHKTIAAAALYSVVHAFGDPNLIDSLGGEFWYQKVDPDLDPDKLLGMMAEMNQCLEFYNKYMSEMDASGRTLPSTPDHDRRRQDRERTEASRGPPALPEPPRQSSSSFKHPPAVMPGPKHALPSLMQPMMKQQPSSSSSGPPPPSSSSSKAVVPSPPLPPIFDTPPPSKRHKSDHHAVPHSSTVTPQQQHHLQQQSRSSNVSFGKPKGLSPPTPSRYSIREGGSSLVSGSDGRSKQRMDTQPKQPPPRASEMEDGEIF